MSTSTLVSGTTGNITQMVNDALAAGWLPNGSPLLGADGTFHQLMYKGLPSAGAGGSSGPADDDPMLIANSAGAPIATATFLSSLDMGNGTLLPAAKLGEDSALLSDGGQMGVKDQSGTQVSSVDIAVTGGVATLTLDPVSAVLSNGQTLSGIAPSGAYTTGIQFTVVDGVITAVHMV